MYYKFKNVRANMWFYFVNIIFNVVPLIRGVLNIFKQEYQ